MEPDRFRDPNSGQLIQRYGEWWILIPPCIYPHCVYVCVCELASFLVSTTSPHLDSSSVKSLHPSLKRSFKEYRPPWNRAVKYRPTVQQVQLLSCMTLVRSADTNDDVIQQQFSSVWKNEDKYLHFCRSEKEQQVEDGLVFQVIGREDWRVMTWTLTLTLATAGPEPGVELHCPLGADLDFYA